MEKLKTILILILLAGLTISLAANVLHRPVMLPHATPLPNTSSGSAATVPVVIRYIDSVGVEHTVVDATINERISREAAQVTAPVAKKLDSLADALKLKPAQIEGYTAASFVATQDSIRFLSRKVDSLKRQTYYYKDKYLTAAFRAAAADQDSAAALAGSSFDFSYDADLKFVDYSKQRHFLGIPIGRRHYYTDISSSDPRLKIKGVEKLTLARRVPALGFRLQALSSYNLDTRGQTLGFGVRFDLGDRFNTGLNYTYSFLLRDWVPTIYAKYDLLQFGR